MNIYFIETEQDERGFFEEALTGHTLRFVSCLDEVDADAEILSIFIHSRIERRFLDQHPNITLITTRSTGYDHIDLAECARRGITVCFVSSYGDNTVAEHTFALILALARRTREAREACKKGTFSYESTRGIELKSATLGVIGTGKIGAHTIRIARAFEMEVVACDIEPQPKLEAALRFRYVSFDELLRDADIISLHVPLTTATYHLLNRAAFARCKRGVLIVNTARGRLIDTDALIDALDNGSVGGAGLDVIEEERVMRRKWSSVAVEEIIEHLQASAAREEPPIKDSGRVQKYHALMHNAELIARPNVVFTPHIAFNSVQAVERINRTTVENISAFLAGKPVNVLKQSAESRTAAISSNTCEDQAAGGMVLSQK